MTLTRSLLTVLIPGLVAITPWLLLLVQHTEATLGFDKNTTLANALVFAAAAVTGSLLEVAGSRHEVAWDAEREPTHAVRENWYAYLSRPLEKEPVGYRYLSRLVTVMYFELGMGLAAPIFLAGASVLAAMRFPGVALVFGIAGLALAVAVGMYFHRQAKCTHEVMCAVRKEINARLAEGG